MEYAFIYARGKEEVGRGDGFARDIYSSFWIDVSNSLFIGEKERAPFVRHDLYKREWEAIGKILAKGFNDTGYFLTMISKSFVQNCFYGDVSNTNTFYFETLSFLSFVFFLLFAMQKSWGPCFYHLFKIMFRRISAC